MAQICKPEGQVEIKCSAEIFFEMFTCKQHHMPKICSDKFPRVELHEGDWASVGSIRKWNYVIYVKTGHIKEKIEQVDKEKRSITFTVVQGDVLKKHYKSLTAKLQVIPKGKGSLVKWTFEYEKLNHKAPKASMFIDILLNLAKDIDAYPADA